MLHLCAYRARRLVIALFCFLLAPGAHVIPSALLRRCQAWWTGTATSCIILVFHGFLVLWSPPSHMTHLGEGSRGYLRLYICWLGVLGGLQFVLSVQSLCGNESSTSFSGPARTRGARFRLHNHRSRYTFLTAISSAEAGQSFPAHPAAFSPRGDI